MPGGEEDAVENDIESDAQQTNSSKTRQHLSRSTCKDNTDTSESDQASGIVEKTNKSVNNQRCSNRLTKRLKREPSPVDSTIKKIAITKPAATTSVGSKTRRPWELWSVEDKDAFFEALCEYGKDFENIQSYIAQRSKKKGIATNMIKNKDQVRHFYYRTWHKISKFLQISECVRKQTQELYGLINYAELRKKIGGGLSEKNRLKLNELVFSGVTTVKHKGKKLRIKTPVCRALKKINNVSDTKEPETDKLPKDIIVEFRPVSNKAWLHVQNLAQNPRVRTRVCLQKRLKCVIEYLQRRWKPYRLKRKEQLQSSLPCSLPQELSFDNPPILRVKPAKDAKIYPLSLSSMDVASSSDVCLEKYMKLSQKVLYDDISKVKKPLSLNQKIQSEKQNEVEPFERIATENLSECIDSYIHPELPELSAKAGTKTLVEDTGYINVLTPPKSVPDLLESTNDLPRTLSILTSLEHKKSLAFSGDETIDKGPDVSFETNTWTFDSKNGKVLEESKKDVQSFGDEKEMDSQAAVNADNRVDSLGSSNKNDLNTLISSLEREKCPEIPVNSEDSPCNTDSLFYKTVRTGWTVAESGFLTFGELYLLLGKPSTIILEYEFEPASKGFNASKPVCCAKNMLSKVFEIAQNYFNDSKNKQILAKQRTSKSTKIKPVGSEKPLKDLLPVLPDTNSTIIKESTTAKDSAVSKSISSSSDSSVDKHVFAMPIGTAPRNIKPPDQNSLKEEIGKLLPGTRRGCRVRRKPLVVQRPLLPREGMPRPMTLVHFVPSISSLTTVLPPNCTPPESKIGIPPAKKVVQLLPSGSSIDVHPIQVPIVKQVRTEAGQNIIFQPNNVPAPHMLVNPASGNPIQIINDQSISCLKSSATSAAITKNCVTSVHKNNSAVDKASLISKIRLPSPPNLDSLSLDMMSESHRSSVTADDTFPTMQDISLLDSSNTSLSQLSPTVSSSFLDELGLSKSKLYYQSPSCFNEDPLSLRRNTPPGSPANTPFRINSPEIQWLNGESTELSLNTFLNSMESPSKMTSHLSADNSNLDSMSRLAPVVDSQVRCLLDECSVDFITKFEDLADVIND